MTLYTIIESRRTTEGIESVRVGGWKIRVSIHRAVQGFAGPKVKLFFILSFIFVCFCLSIHNFDINA